MTGSPMQNYICLPLKVIDEIPIFSSNDSYLKNYEKIAMDHLKSLELGKGNPFMTSSQIESSEKVTRNLLRSYVTAGSMVLDAGIGLGYLLGDMPEYKRFGIDVSIAYLKRAKLLGIDVALACLEDMPYQDAFFDAVVSTDVLEHVLQLDVAVTQLLRVLKSDGYLIIRVPHKETLKSYCDDQAYQYSHIRNFDLFSLRLYFEKVFGLEYVEHQFSGWDFCIVDQLKIRLPRTKSNLSKLLNEPDMQLPELDVLRRALNVTEEELVDSLIAIRNKHPITANKLWPTLIEPLGITVVFRKSPIL